MCFFARFFLKAERLPIKTYTVADGLLRDSVIKIKQDSRGFLWFCTSDGISRFDGYGFTNFTTSDGLPDRHTKDFLETQTGEILIATEGGLAKLDSQADSKNHLFTTLLLENSKTKIINVLFENKNGTVFVGTANGLFKLLGNNEFEPLNLGSSVSVTSIIEDRRGWLWVGTENGLFKILPDGNIENFTADDGLTETNITSLLEDRNGRIWVSLRPQTDAGLYRLIDNPQKNQNIVERVFTSKDGLPSPWIMDLHEASDSRFWVATIRGLCQWREGEASVCKTYTDANDVCSMEIWTISEDKDENLWLGTRCGVKKLARYGFTAYNEPSGTVSEKVNSIFENSAGEVFGSYNDGAIRTVTRFDGEKFETIKPNFPLGVGYFGWGNRHTVLQDKAGEWWFPTANGLYKFLRPAQFKDLAAMTPQKIPNLQDTQIFRLFEDSRGDFWIADLKTVVKKDGAITINKLWLWKRSTNEWSDLTNDLGIGDERIVTSFAEDKSGNVWIGGSGNSARTALIRYRGGRFDIFTQAGNEPLTGEMISLFVDSKNRLWMTNPAMGLLRLDDVNAAGMNFTRYTPLEGISTIGVITVTEDAYGRIYVGTARGLDRLTPETGQIEHFTTADGLPASYVEMSFRDRNNNLWFGTDKGMARFTPEPKRMRQPPNVLITGLRVSGIARPISVLGEANLQNLELNSDQKQITVDFLGLGANLGENLKYEYRFGEMDWTPTTERTLNFANLSVGDYLLQIRAQTADGIYSQTPAGVSFKIAAPIWARWWFLLLAGCLTGFVIYTIYKYRLQRLLELEKVRTRIATDLHDDIGANLTRISLLSEVAKQKAANGNGQLLSSIADIARESVASMNDIVWAIAPEHDSLLDLTRRMRQHAEEIFALA